MDLHSENLVKNFHGMIVCEERGIHAYSAGFKAHWNAIGFRGKIMKTWNFTGWLRKCKRSLKRYWEKLSILINMHNINETDFGKYQAYQTHAHVLLQL